MSNESIFNLLSYLALIPAIAFLIWAYTRSQSIQGVIFGGWFCWVILVDLQESSRVLVYHSASKQFWDGLSAVLFIYTIKALLTGWAFGLVIVIPAVLVDALVRLVRRKWTAAQPEGNENGGDQGSA